MRKFGGTSGGGEHPFFNEDIFGDFFSGFGNNDGFRFNFTNRNGDERIFRNVLTDSEETEMSKCEWQ